MELEYRRLSKELEEQILSDRKSNWRNPYRTEDETALRRTGKASMGIWRPPFVRDVETIIHLPMYNRYADKTQVFSFYENDDITRRALHVQLVSRISRNIGSVLGLNLDLIEAIALGHDIGHTPFGHAGERYLSELYKEYGGRYFNHNVNSVRILDGVFCRNLSLQTLDGILCHNGEFEMKEYRPRPLGNFSELDSHVEDCYVYGEEAVLKLVPCTLEGCVVRISDMIAYLGKDRQDAKIAHIIENESEFSKSRIGTLNAEIINNLTVDIIEHSYGKDHIALSPGAYEDLKLAKKENYERIYRDSKVNKEYEHDIRPMFEELYVRLLSDLRSGNEDSVIFKHHVDYVRKHLKYYSDKDYRAQEDNQIVVDFMSAMTDDYFVALHKFLFPQSRYRITYHSYFEDIDRN